jgi:hypothetical protein
MVAICKLCNKEHVKIRTKADPKANSYVYEDRSGKRWHGRICPICCPTVQMERNRRKGIKPRDQIVDKSNAKARWAERAAERHFTDQGYKVEITKGTGPDLTLFLDGKVLTCEVKLAIPKSKHPDCFFVQAVAPKRRKDDLIAIVFSNGFIHVEPMKKHLRACPKCGLRAVTSLIRNRRWIGAPECSNEDKINHALVVSKRTWKHGRYAKIKGPPSFQSMD